MSKSLVLLLTTLLVFVTAISGIACDVSDENGNGAADTTVPMISGVIISDITETTATISWTTNESATSNILYGPTTNYGLYYHSTLLDTTVDKTSHSLTLSGLLSDTIYHFQVKSEGATGNKATSGDQIFMTKEADTTAPVIFPDANLETAIREVIGKSQGDISQSDLVALTNFNANSRGITDLTGIEHCVNLTWLNLNYNQISDLSPLSYLTGLSDIELWGNKISNLSPLSYLTNLTSLTLGNNQISDLLPLSSLISLTDLSLAGNQISNLLPLSYLTSLTKLWLSDNQISDIEPLVNNPRLGQGDSVYLGDNQLSTTSINTYVPALEAREVEISYTTTPGAIIQFTKYDITPSVSQIGDTVYISVTCMNSGGSPVTYPVILKINGVYEQTEEVNLDPGKSQVVIFIITESEAGTYEVNVNELASSFVVQ